MNDALVSILIPVYNRQNYIRQCLLSCVEQDYRPIEIVIVNDGSTDDTDKIIQEFIREFENEKSISVRYITQKNQGAPVARNLGLEVASGNFIQFLDSDDLFTHQSISVKVNEFQNCDVVFGDCIKIDGNGQHVRDYRYIYYSEEDIIPYLAGTSIVTGCLLFKRECFEAVKFDTSVHVLQERELCIRLLIQKFKFKYVKEFVYYHRIAGADNISSVHWTQKNPLRYIHTHKLILSHISHLQADIVRKASRRIARDLWRRGRHLMLSKNQEAAQLHFKYAIEVNGGKIPKGSLFRFFASVIPHYRVEQVYCLLKYKGVHKYLPDNS